MERVRYGKRAEQLDDAAVDHLAPVPEAKARRLMRRSASATDEAPRTTVTLWYR